MMQSALVSNILPALLPSILPCILIVLAVKLWSVYNENTRDTKCPAPLPEGSMGWPFIGETIQLVTQGAEFYRKKYLKHGRVFKTHILGQPTIRAIGADNVRRILQGEGDIVTSHYPFTVRSVLGSRSIVISSGAEHDRLRKLVSKAFRFDCLSQYVPYIQQYAQDAIERWCDRGEVLGLEECRALVFGVAGKLLCGFQYDENETKRLTSVFEEMIDNMFSFPVDLPGTRFHKAIKNRNILHRHIEDSLKEKRDRADSSDSEFRDLLQVICTEAGDDGEEKMDTEKLKELALELLFAGHTTTASASTMLLVYLYQNPHIIEKIRRELDEHQLLDDECQLTFGTIVQLKYVSCVVKEILRISPPVGAGYRKVIKTFELEGKQVPVGWTVVFSIRETQKYATNFTKPDEFDPDRFMPDREEDKQGDRFNYIPFGGGPRGCVGKQLALLFLKIFVVTLARSCRWQLVNPEELKVCLMPSPHPVDGLPLRFSRFDCNANRVDLKIGNEVKGLEC
ncbi:cytochrome P450 26A1-like isoform X2 [Ptychodera flava]